MKLRTCLTALSATVFLQLGSVHIAGAAPPVIDGNLTDMQAFVASLISQGNGCGLDADDPLDTRHSDPGLIPCTGPKNVNDQWPNGIEITRQVFAYQHGTTSIFLGLRAQGNIGDVDDNGNPDTACGSGCDLQCNLDDFPGIGDDESYQWRFDLNCDGVVNEAVVRVQNRPASEAVGKGGNLTAADLPGFPAGTTGVYAYNGHDLEVRIDLPAPLISFKYAEFRANMFDGKGEDFGTGIVCFAPCGIDVEKVANPARLCPNQTTTFTITVSNTGFTPDSIVVKDFLPSDLAFVVGSTGGSCSVGAPTVVGNQLTFPKFTLDSGSNCTITFNATAGPDCFGTVRDSVVASTTFTYGACIPADDRTCTAEDTDIFDLECAAPPCVNFDFTCSPDSSCAGEPVTLTGTATNCSKSPEDIRITIEGVSQVFTNVPANTDKTFSRTVTMPACPPPGSVTFHGSTVATNECNPTPGVSKQDSCAVTCVPPPCLDLKLVCNPDSACAGAPILLTATATNCSPGEERVDITIEGTTFSHCTIAVGDTCVRTKTVNMPRCNNGQLVTFEASGRATNKCPDKSDNKDASCSVTCTVPEIQVTKVAPDTASAGATLHYVITVKNPSSHVGLENIVVTDNLCQSVGNPRNFTDTCTGSLSPVTSGNTVTWPVFNLAPSDSCKIEFDVTLVECADCPNEVGVVGFCGDARAEDTATATTHCEAPGICRLTGGGCLNERGDQKGRKEHTFGGNVSPLHSGGGPTGNEWQHVVRTVPGKAITFNFHSHDAHIDSCSVVPPGPCSPHGTITRADFSGTGLYSIESGGREFTSTFTAVVIDHNEGACNRDARDQYGIRVVNTDPTSPDFTVGQVVFELPLTTLERTDCGNLQIHETPARIFGGLSATARSAPIRIPDPQPIPKTDQGADQAGSLKFLNRAAPNPFTSTVSYSYRVVDDGSDRSVDVGVYNVAGRLVSRLASGVQPPGTYTVQWDGKGADGVKMANGVYFLRARVGAKLTVTRIVYLR